MEEGLGRGRAGQRCGPHGLFSRGEKKRAVKRRGHRRDREGARLQDLVTDRTGGQPRQVGQEPREETEKGWQRSRQRTTLDTPAHTLDAQAESLVHLSKGSFLSPARWDTLDVAQHTEDRQQPGMVPGARRVTVTAEPLMDSKLEAAR